jgi:hypothetical protein
LADEQQLLISKLHSEGKMIELRERMSQVKKISDMIILFNNELRKQQEQMQREQNAGSSQNPAARMSVDLSTRASQPTATSTNSVIPNSVGSGVSEVSSGSHVHIGAGVGATGIAAVANSTQFEQQSNARSWSGVLCVGTGNDKTRLSADTLVALTPLKATMAQ